MTQKKRTTATETVTLNTAATNRVELNVEKMNEYLAAAFQYGNSKKTMVASEEFVKEIERALISRGERAFRRIMKQISDVPDGEEDHAES